MEQLPLKVLLMLLAVILVIGNGASASSRQLLGGASSSSSSDDDDQAGVMGYWEEKLGHDVRMPRMLRAMITPLKANEADFLISKITDSGQNSYLPSNAPSFCKRTSIICDRKDYDLILVSNNNYQKFNVKSEELGHGGFFREKPTLVKGARIELKINNLEKDDGQYDQPRAFLPRGLVQLFPFTKEGLPQLASMLGISKEAVPSMQETVSDCFSQQGLPGEIMSCPTSIEAMADFVASTMGFEKPMGVLDLSGHHTQDFLGKTQTVLDVKTLKGDPTDKYVTCHDMFFPFRVFYCHYLQQTKLFVATLQASDGSIHDRAAVCHYDTSLWNPNHVSFSDLGTKPGESEACHWMAESGLVFLHQ